MGSKYIGYRYIAVTLDTVYRVILEFDTALLYFHTQRNKISIFGTEEYEVN